MHDTGCHKPDVGHIPTDLCKPVQRLPKVHRIYYMIEIFLVQKEEKIWIFPLLIILYRGCGIL